MRPGHRPVPRIRTEARRADQPLHAGRSRCSACSAPAPRRSWRRSARRAPSPARRRIIKVGGAYHGWSDQMVYGLRIPGTGRLEAVGIPRGRPLRRRKSIPNDLDALRALLRRNRLTRRHRGGASSSRWARKAAPVRSRCDYNAARARAVRRIRRAADLRRGGHRLPRRHGRRAGLLRRQARPHRASASASPAAIRWPAASADGAT